MSGLVGTQIVCFLMHMLILYYFTSEAIQKACPIKLWVALIEDWPLNTSNPVELNGAVDDAIDKMGLTNGNIFLAGHSLGESTPPKNIRATAWESQQFA